MRGGSGTAGRSGREVAPFAASRNLARCSFAVHREERARERARERDRKRKRRKRDGVTEETERERERGGEREKPRG